MIRQSNIDRSLYTKFKNRLLTSGTIKWHYNQDGRNVCIMNDYSVNGHLMPNSFAHISSEFTDSDTPVIHCSCQIYPKYNPNIIKLSKMLKLKRDRKLHLRHRACTAVFSRNICSMPTKLLIKDVQTSHNHWKWSDRQFSS